ncbi:GntR family transcriptional regulator [Virgibacillus sp. W0181]|uniref:GntR family transcriptional regulator n=1 Tax=Virgibacillus sp. W0181 TaxID=3391581 RepID=UPI003F484C2F
MRGLDISVKKGSLKDRIAFNIKNAIFEGKLQPGDKVTEVELAEEIGVSRGPVREAMQLLEMEGLFASEPYKGTRVTEITEDEVMNLLIPIRLNIESYALTKIIPLNEKQLYVLTNIIGQMQQAVEKGHVSTIVELDIKFHETLIMFVDLKSTKKIWIGIVNRIRLYFLYNGKIYNDLSYFIQEHQMLLDAIMTGNLQTAIDSLKPHMLDTVDSLRIL